MESPPPKIEVRKATEEDYEAVLDIDRNIYSGADYIPYYYHMLVTDPDHTYYVCLVDGEVAAFQGVCLLDDNKSLMIRSSRVKAKFQGQRPLRHIRRKIHEDHKDLPGEKNLRSAVGNLAYYVHSETYRSHNKLLLVERVVQLQDFNPRQITSPTKREFGEAKEISFDQFRHFFEIDPLMKYLFPNDLITTDGLFFDVLASNVGHIQKLTQRIFVTSPLFGYILDTDGDNKQDFSATSVSTHLEESLQDKDFGTRGLLAILKYYFTASRLFFRINVFGRASKGSEAGDLASILKPALENLQTLCSDNAKVVTVTGSIVSHERLPVETVLQAVGSFGLKEDPHSDSKTTEQYSFEQGFDNLLKF